MVGDSTTSASGSKRARVGSRFGSQRAKRASPVRRSASARRSRARAWPESSRSTPSKATCASGKRPAAMSSLAVRGQAVDLRPQLLLPPEALEDLPRPREQAAGLDALGARGVGAGVGQRAEGRLVLPGVEEGPAVRQGLPAGGPRGRGLDALFGDPAPLEPPRVSRRRAAARRRRPPWPPWPCPRRGAARRRRGAARAGGREPRCRGPPPARRAAAPAPGSRSGGCPRRARARAPPPGRGGEATRPRRGAARAPAPRAAGAAPRRAPAG